MRFGLSAIEKRDVWSRWKAGQTQHEIGRAFDKPHDLHSRCVAASWRYSSRRSSPFPVSTYAGGAGGPLARDRFRFVDSGDRTTSRSSYLHSEPITAMVGSSRYKRSVRGLCGDDLDLLDVVVGYTVDQQEEGIDAGSVGRLIDGETLRGLGGSQMNALAI